MNNIKEKIYIGKSDLHGKGIFASKNIRKGEVIFTVKGEKINFLIDNKEQAKKAGLNWFGFGKNQWIDVENNYCNNLNHSCNPNSGIKNKIHIIALKNINKDEEITFDYSINEADIFWSFKCNCGHKNCRKNIKSIQFLSTDLYNKHKSFISRYYQMVYRRFNINHYKNTKDLKKEWINFLKTNN
jgi:hypothetical protein